MKFSKFLLEAQIDAMVLVLEDELVSKCPENLIGTDTANDINHLKKVLLVLMDSKTKWSRDSKAPSCVDAIMKVLNPSVAKEMKTTCSLECPDTKSSTDNKECDDKVDYAKEISAKNAIDHTYKTIENVLRELISNVDIGTKVDAKTFTRRIATLLVQKHKETIK